MLSSKTIKLSNSVLRYYRIVGKGILRNSETKFYHSKVSIEQSNNKRQKSKISNKTCYDTGSKKPIFLHIRIAFL